MKINNNMANYINNNLNKVNENIEKIANPAKTENIVNAFVEDVFNSEIDTSFQQINNFNEAIGFMQIADGALSNISDNLNNIKTLQTAANNAALNSDNLSAINKQIQKYAQNINDTLNQTTYNDKSVFGQFNFNGTEINTSMPSFSIENMEDFEKALNSARSSIGAFQNEAVSKIDNLSTYVINLSKAKSQNEVDVAKAITGMKNSEVTLNAAVLAQVHKMNLSHESLMNLLKG